MSVEILISDRIALFGDIDVDQAITGVDPTLIATFGFHRFTSADDTIINDHAARMADLLIEQFRKKALKLIATCHIGGNIGQTIENTMSDFLMYRSVTAAGGEQLDGIGEIIGQDRNGLDDEAYRQAIITRIFINSNAGTPESLIAATRLLTEATRVRYYEVYPGTVLLHTDGLAITLGTVAALDAIAPGGVKVYLTYLPYTFEAFITASEAGIPVDGLGVSEWDVTGGDTDYYLEGGEPVGGRLVELVTT